MHYPIRHYSALLIVHITDVGNTPTHAAIEYYRRNFGDDYFSFNVRGVHYIVLNTQLHSDPSGAPDAYHEQNTWLSKDLEQARGKFAHVIVFQHIPWFLKSAEEEDEYFNIPNVRRGPMLDMLQRGGVSACFAGHYHRNSYGMRDDINDDSGDVDDDEDVVKFNCRRARIDADGHHQCGWQAARFATIILHKHNHPMLVPSGDDVSGLRVVILQHHKIHHQYHAFHDAPTHISLE